MEENTTVNEGGAVAEATAAPVMTAEETAAAELTDDLSALADATVENTPVAEGAKETGATEAVGETEAPAEAQTDGAAEANGKRDFSEEYKLFDRAVRAGLATSDILSIKSRAAVERMVEMAEKANGISRPEQDQTDGDAGTPDAETVEGVIEAMRKDGGYDAKLMNLLGGLVKENASLRTARETAAREEFFDKQLGTLGEGVRGHVDAAHKSQLKAKFDLIKAGYRAQGAKVRDDVVFQEAARLALGDLMGRAAEERKASALEQRRNLTLARPGGESGRRGGATAEDDPFAEFVAAIG